MKSKRKPTRPAAEPVPLSERLHAKDLAIAEGCSVRTARRLMKSGALGRIRGRSSRDRWVTRAGYLTYLQTV